MNKIKNLLAVIGTSIALTGCNDSYNPEKDETIIAIKEGNRLMHYYLRANPEQMTIEEMNFIQQYDPKKATQKESLMIELLYHSMGSSPLEPLNKELTTKQRWNWMEIEKKLAFYHRLKELNNLNHLK